MSSQPCKCPRFRTKKVLSYLILFYLILSELKCWQWVTWLLVSERCHSQRQTIGSVLLMRVLSGGFGFFWAHPFGFTARDFTALVTVILSSRVIDGEIVRGKTAALRSHNWVWRERREHLKLQAAKPKAMTSEILKCSTGSRGTAEPGEGSLTCTFQHSCWYMDISFTFD